MEGEEGGRETSEALRSDEAPKREKRDREKDDGKRRRGARSALHASSPNEARRFGGREGRRRVREKRRSHWERSADKALALLGVIEERKTNLSIPHAPAAIIECNAATGTGNCSSAMSSFA